MSKQTFQILSTYILRAFCCVLFIIIGIFVISVATPFDIFWISGFVLMGLGMCGIILQLFLGTKDYYTKVTDKVSQK